jgi:hypothetical protein
MYKCYVEYKLGFSRNFIYTETIRQEQLHNITLHRRTIVSPTNDDTTKITI